MSTRRDSLSSTTENASSKQVSSPLRRKSIIAQIIPANLAENDDKAEWLARRREVRQEENQNVSNSLSSAKRKSLGFGTTIAQMPTSKITEHISQCIKLNTENKINVKNAFNLDMINFMTYMVRKKDANISSFQVASTSLDVSTKIYGYRIDGIHTSILKMMGGSSKQINKERDPKDEEDGPNNDSQGEERNIKGIQKEAKKKKKRKKQSLLVTVESLKGTIEEENPKLLAIQDSDAQSVDMLHQAVLPLHANSRFYMHPYNDVILDTKMNDNEEIQKNLVKVPLPKVEDVSNLEICPPFANFQFLGWSENQMEEELPEPSNVNLEFDLEASLPDNDNHMDCTTNYVNTDEGTQDLNMCVQGKKQVENIVDLCNIITSTTQNKMSEYSYIHKTAAIHWAGPMYWKIKSLQRSISNGKVMETCRHELAKKKKQLEVQYGDEIESVLKDRFSASKTVKLQIKTSINWREDSITLPRDVHYDIQKALTFYYCTYIVLNPFENNHMNTTQLSDDAQIYNYDNENDKTDYCPNVDTDDHQGDDIGCNNEEGFNINDDCVQSTQALIGDNLVAAPKLVNKIFLPYSLRVKKVDMHQLKKCIWKLLTKPNCEKENVDATNAVQQQVDKITTNSDFSSVYKKLPKMLSKNNSEALSAPIALISLLHLANEKMLDIQSTADKSDLIVSQS